MDIFFQKAKVFAQETAKKSQEIAIEAAKMSQEIALETAKRSKEIAVEASKKADELKKLAEELPPSIASAASRMAGELSSSSRPVSPVADEELQAYGITTDLRDFVRGLTINTFKEFPLEEYEGRVSGGHVGGLPVARLQGLRLMAQILEHGMCTCALSPKPQAVLLGLMLIQLITRRFLLYRCT